MINLSGISKRFAHKLLYDDASVALKPGEKIGLIGANGSGKTTLMNIIAGVEQPDSGEVMTPRGFRVGYLEQEFVSPGDKTVIEEVKGAFFRNEVELQQINQQLAVETNAQALERLMNKYETLEHEFELKGGYDLEVNCRKVLSGLGFTEDMMSRRCSCFSGGQKMRIALAKLLVEPLDCILLDEPTNHLDLPAIVWLEEFLKNYPGLAVIISHDRCLLNNVVRKVLEISGRKFYTYDGNYDYYVEEKAHRIELIQKTVRLEQKERRKVERFIERFRYKNTRASMVQSRIKRLDQQQQTDIPVEETYIDFRFPPPERSGYEVAKMSGVSKSYGSHQVLNNIDFTLLRGEKVAFTGKNGTGKSTLLKIMCGEMEPDTGTVKLGTNVKIGYFSQFYTDQLDSERTVMEEVEKVSNGRSATEVRSILGRFFFSGEDVFKKVGVLSGGEKSRVLLARLFVSDNNVLVLDEPTNHLDMGTQSILLDALEEFEGTVCFVSHDRFFVNTLTTRLLYFDTDGITAYPGTLEEFLERKKEQEAVYSDTGKKENVRRDQKRQEAEERNQRYKMRKQYDIRIEEIEKRLEQLMLEETELEQKLADSASYKDENTIKEITARYSAVRSEIELLTIEWDQQSLEREKWI